jgi:hypothetical protein
MSILPLVANLALEDDYDILMGVIKMNCGLCDYAFVNNTKISTYKKDTKEYIWHIPKDNIEKEIKSQECSTVKLLFHSGKKKFAWVFYFDFKQMMYSKQIFQTPFYIPNPNL